MNIKHLPIRNLKKKPMRTAALLFIAVFLVFAMFGGSVMILSFQRGIDSLEARIGADIIVVPDEAEQELLYESILLDGTPGYFYMDKSYLEQVAGIEGVEKVSAQYFLATADSACCSEPLQIIGFDPETDFSIQPWIQKRYKKGLSDYEVVVGSDVLAPIGSSLQIYAEECNVVAKLDSTGTSLDRSVYMNSSTVRKLLTAAQNNGFDILSEKTPDSVISTIYIKVKDGYDAEKITDNINLNLRNIKAIKTQNMLIGISDSLSGISSTITILIAVVWVMSLVIMLITFSVLVNERKKEFAILRIIGTSRKMLAKVILTESALLSVSGAIIGILLTCMIIFPFRNLIEEGIGLPFLLPGWKEFLFLSVISLIASVIIGSISSAYAAFRLSRVDAGVTLRGGD